jgi:hypothetical protein
VFGESKNNQKEKGRFSPYKAGGGKRSWSPLMRKSMQL